MKLKLLCSLPFATSRKLATSGFDLGNLPDRRGVGSGTDKGALRNEVWTATPGGLARNPDLVRRAGACPGWGCFCVFVCACSDRPVDFRRRESPSRGGDDPFLFQGWSGRSPGSGC